MPPAGAPVVDVIARGETEQAGAQSAMATLGSSSSPRRPEMVDGEATSTHGGVDMAVRQGGGLHGGGFSVWEPVGAKARGSSATTGSWGRRMSGGGRGGVSADEPTDSECHSDIERRVVSVSR